MARFLVTFIVLQLLLFGASQLPAFNVLVVSPLTSLLSHMCAGLLAGDGSPVSVVGKVVMDARSGFGVSIDPTCLAIEPSFLLVAAMLAYPAADWRRKLVGLTIGLLLIQVLNLVRIIALLYLGTWKPAWYPVAHDYVAQGLVILAVAGMFLAWMPRQAHIRGAR